MGRLLIVFLKINNYEFVGIKVNIFKILVSLLGIPLKLGTL